MNKKFELRRFSEEEMQARMAFFCPDTNRQGRKCSTADTRVKSLIAFMAEQTPDKPEGRFSTSFLQNAFSSVKGYASNNIGTNPDFRQAKATAIESGLIRFFSTKIPNVIHYSLTQKGIDYYCEHIAPHVGSSAANREDIEKRIGPGIEASEQEEVRGGKSMKSDDGEPAQTAPETQRKKTSKSPPRRASQVEAGSAHDAFMTINANPDEASVTPPPPRAKSPVRTDSPLLPNVKRKDFTSNVKRKDFTPRGAALDNVSLTAKMWGDEIISASIEGDADINVSMLLRQLNTSFGNKPVAYPEIVKLINESLGDHYPGVAAIQDRCRIVAAEWAAARNNRGID